MWSGQDNCYVQVLANMNEHDINEWTGSCCCGDGFCVMHYFLSFFLRHVFPEMAAHFKGAMIVFLFFTVKTLRNTGNAFTVCMFLGGTQ